MVCDVVAVIKARDVHACKERILDVVIGVVGEGMVWNVEKPLVARISVSVLEVLIVVDGV